MFHQPQGNTPRTEIVIFLFDVNGGHFSEVGGLDRKEKCLFILGPEGGFGADELEELKSQLSSFSS